MLFGVIDSILDVIHPDLGTFRKCCIHCDSVAMLVYSFIDPIDIVDVLLNFAVEFVYFVIVLVYSIRDSFQSAMKR